MLFLKSTVSGLVDRLMATYRHIQKRNDTINSLHRLNDRLLTDIGIERTQIEDAVDGRLGTSTAPVYRSRRQSKPSLADCFIDLAACRTLS